MADEQIVTTCTVTNNDETVTCSGESFLTDLDVNDVFMKNADGEPTYHVASVTSDTEFELTAKYAGSTESVECVIQRSFTTNLHLARPASGDQGIGEILTDDVIDIIDTEMRGPTDNITQADGKHIATDQIRARDGDGLKVYDDGGNGIFVEDGGQVAIGSTSPDADLDITSANATTSLLIDNTAADGDPILGFQLSGTSTFTMGVDDGDSDKFKIGTTAIGTNTRLTIDSSGNVGIGTASPDDVLHVVGGGILLENAQWFRGTQAGGGSQVAVIGVNSDNYTTVLSAKADSGIKFTSSAMSPLMTILNTGDVGIGETAPVTLTEWSSTAPYLTLHNTTEEDGAGGRESKIIARGEQSGSEETVLGEIEFSHDGTSDDEKGKFIVRVNDGNDGPSPSLVGLQIDSVGILRSLACYSHDMNGETIRDLQINDSGELGYDSSVLRGKINIKDMEDTSWLYDLRPVNFEPRKKNEEGDYLEESTGEKKYGLVAEEVEKVNPAFVFYDGEEITGVHYGRFVSVLINEIQRLNERIVKLETNH